MKISPIARVTLGLLLLTVSLLLIADLLGMMPNQKKIQLDTRKSMAESIAIQVSSQIGSERLDSILNAIVHRNRDILSIGLRTTSDKMVAQTAEHEKLWPNEKRDYSTETEIIVPIYDDKGRWGTLEVKYEPDVDFWTGLLHGQSLFTLVLFVLISGGMGYWLFLKRVLSELDPSSAVPERVRTALDILGEGIVILDQSERIVLVNRAFEDKVGMNEDELFGKHLASLEWISDESDDILSSEKLPWTELFETNTPPKTRHMKLNTLNNGVLTVDVSVSPVYGSKDSLKGVIISIDDVTLLDKKNAELAHTLKRLKVSQEEIVRQNIELAELATRDPLTHAFNRRALYEGFNELMEQAGGEEDSISCIILDIDHFKSVNDNYGHAAGDQVIKYIADVLHENNPYDGLVGRYGGEEFVMVLPGRNEVDAAYIAEEIRLQIEEKSIEVEGYSLAITSSFGVSTLKHPEQTSDQLVDQADQALYKAKKSGRNCVIRYSQIDKDTQEVIQLEHKPRTRQEPQKRVEPELVKKQEEEKTQDLLEQEVVDEDGKLSIDAFDMMGNSSRIVVIDRLSQAIRVAKRKQTRLAVLTIYIDTIQTINNTIGYGSAEKLRKIAYQRLNTIFRESDSILPDKNLHKNYSLSRSGDSEFTAVLTDLDNSEMVTWITQRMFADLKKQVEVDGTEVIMTANVGASFFPDDGSTAEALLANSNMALKEANKHDERESLMLFNSEMNAMSRKQLLIEGQLYQAIENEEFVLYYQPIINLKTGRVEKLEALIRWQHPELGIVSPDAFIPIAEHSGLIKEMGFWIVKTAVKQLKNMHKMGFEHLKMSINVSAAQFNQSNLAEQIINIVHELDIDPEKIVFEITETAIIKRFDKIIEEVSTLSEAGFEIALDDFGTGYSSLDFLRKFPISWVKIDRSFMLDFPAGINDVAIVSGLIGLSHNLGMRVIAEGVEEEQQLSTLTDLGCDQAQGYIIARPLTAEQAARYLLDNTSEKLLAHSKTVQASNQQHWDTVSVINAVINQNKQ